MIFDLHVKDDCFFIISWFLPESSSDTSTPGILCRDMFVGIFLINYYLLSYISENNNLNFGSSNVNFKFLICLADH